MSARSLIAIQLYEPASSQDEAEMVLAGCQAQVGYLFGRVLEPTPVIDSDTWRVQAFFEDDPGCSQDALALVGLRRVMVPESLEIKLKS